MQTLRIENPEWVYLITSRTINSELWFLHNKKLEKAILAYLAKYAAQYGVVIYAFVLVGNHYHLIAGFPQSNRAAFMRCFNSMVARLTASHTPNYPHGKLWARRYSAEILGTDADVREKLMYCALQAPNSGLTERIGEYPLYNSFFDAARGLERKFEVVDWASYNERRRFNPKLRPKDFAETFVLRYERLPGLAAKRADYSSALQAECEERRIAVVKKRVAEKKGFLGPAGIAATKRGSRPFKTKKSDRWSFRPIVICCCKATREVLLHTYFSIRDAYQRASIKFRAGLRSVEFPIGTYPPPCLSVVT